jgi:hypothetical protein
MYERSLSLPGTLSDASWGTGEAIATAARTMVKKTERMVSNS